MRTDIHLIDGKTTTFEKVTQRGPEISATYRF